MSAAVVITTRRALLRDFVAGDEAQLRAYQADPAYRRFDDPEDAPPSGELLCRFMAWAAERPRRNFQLAVADRRDPGQLVGCCGLRMEHAPSGEAEFGIEIAPRYWSRYGYAAEIAAAMLAFGFRDLGLTAVRASTVSANRNAARIARHFGFEPLEEAAASAWLSERGWREVTWRLSREGWERLPARWRG